ncbi:hypothetical protein DPPLL_33810 [Desulfofustis limnaeus]|uniref:Uncharacterized protein n=1 Tax=Desulfofustis limnaeus TaxID=2740163 RepID=A0ABM7WDF7_9BACT|nr:hypothetical protein DPPLL_33810 [Desulfofustis limnaeus]
MTTPYRSGMVAISMAHGKQHYGWPRGGANGHWLEQRLGGIHNPSPGTTDGSHVPEMREKKNSHKE